jgi:hypothetical protein
MGRTDGPWAKGRRWRRSAAGLVVAIVVTAGVVVLAAGAAALGSRARSHSQADTRVHIAPGDRVVLWGDSLAYESALPFVARVRASAGEALAVDVRT